jgi:hypothetical protein
MDTKAILPNYTEKSKHLVAQELEVKEWQGVLRWIDEGCRAQPNVTLKTMVYVYGNLGCKEILPFALTTISRLPVREAILALHEPVLSLVRDELLLQAVKQLNKESLRFAKSVLTTEEYLTLLEFHTNFEPFRDLATAVDFWLFKLPHKRYSPEFWAFNSRFNGGRGSLQKCADIEDGCTLDERKWAKWAYSGKPPFAHSSDDGKADLQTILESFAPFCEDGKLMRRDDEGDLDYTFNNPLNTSSWVPKEKEAAGSERSWLSITCPEAYHASPSGPKGLCLSWGEEARRWIIRDQIYAARK